MDNAATECPIIDLIASADDAMRSLAADGTINLACSTAAADWCMCCYQGQWHRHSAICFATSAARFETSSIQSPPHPMEPGGPKDVLVSTGQMALGVWRSLRTIHGSLLEDVMATSIRGDSLQPSDSYWIYPTNGADDGSCV